MDGSANFLSVFLTIRFADYLALVEHYNQVWWPLQLISLLMGFWMVRFLLTNHKTNVIGILFAVFYAWIGWAYFWQEYNSVSSWAPLYAAFFFVQATLMLMFSHQLKLEHPSRNLYTKIGYFWFVICVLVPTLGVTMTDQSWWQVSMVGIMPTATTLATLGLMLLLEKRLRWLLGLIPFTWTLIDGLQQFNLGNMYWFIGPMAAVIIVILMVVSRMHYWQEEDCTD